MAPEEREGIAVGKVHGRSYAFVTLERIGGVAVYDVTGATPSFVNYVNPRDFSGSTVGPDSGPEIAKFVHAEDSPMLSPLLVIANAISGTVTIWAFDSERLFFGPVSDLRRRIVEIAVESRLVSPI